MQLFIVPRSIKIGELDRVQERLGFAPGFVCPRSLVALWAGGRRRPCPCLGDSSCAWETVKLGRRSGFWVAVPSLRNKKDRKYGSGE